MIKWLGKKIFPDLPPWQREVQVKVLLLFVGPLLLVAIVTGLVLLFHHKH